MTLGSTKIRRKSPVDSRAPPLEETGYSAVDPSAKEPILTTTDSGLRRVSVHSGSAVADLSLPAAVPVATLIPSIVDILGHRPDPAPGPWRLLCLGGTALGASTTLMQNDIRDGAVLMLSQDTVAPPAVGSSDVAETVAATLRTTGRGPGRGPTRLVGALAATCVTTAGALVLIRNSLSTNMTRHEVVATAAAATCSLVALLAAAVANRAYREPVAALALSIHATLFATVAGFLAVPGAPGVLNVLLAAMAAAVTAVLAVLVAGAGTVTLTAVACATATIALAALAAAITAVPWQAVGSLTALASFGLLEVSARMSIVLAGLSPQLSPTTDADDPLTVATMDPTMDPTMDEVADNAVRADQWLTGLLAAFTTSAAIGAVSTLLVSRGTCGPRARDIALAAVTGALLLLRTRAERDARRTAVLSIGGIVTITTTFAIIATKGPQHGPWIIVAMATLAAAAMYFSFVAPALSLSPVTHRSVDLLEFVALVAMVPLTCWTCGAVDAVRGLHLA